MTSERTGINIRLTYDSDESIKYIIAKSPIIKTLRLEGHKIDKAFLFRFAIMYIVKHPELFMINYDLLIAASNIDFTAKILLDTEKEIKTWASLKRLSS